MDQFYKIQFVSLSVCKPRLLNRFKYGKCLISGTNLKIRKGSLKKTVTQQSGNKQTLEK